MMLLFVGGCIGRTHTVPVLADALVGRAQPIATVEEQACGTYIFAIDWSHLFESNRARVRSSWGEVERGGPEERRALYQALERLPEATHIASHRAHKRTAGVVLAGHPLFGERCVTVRVSGLSVLTQSSQ